MCTMDGGQLGLVILLSVYGIYCGWAKFCEHRWPKHRPQESEQ
jgi:hypothetical protein